MANEGNLIPFGTGERTENEERKLRSKGGVNSGVTRRRQRDARKILTAILKAKPDLDKSTKTNLATLGIKGQGKTGDVYDIETIALAAIAQKSMKGDVSAVRLMLEIMGEDARSRTEQDKLALIRERDAAGDLPEDYDDGFMDALNGRSEEVFADGTDTPDNLDG